MCPPSYSVLLIQKFWLLHMWGMPDTSKICLQEIQEFPLFLSPPVIGSSSAFLESEHLSHSALGSAPSSVAQPLASSLLPLRRHLYASPSTLHPLNSVPEISHTLGHLSFPIYINYFFLLRIVFQSLGKTDYWQESSLFSTVCHWLLLTEKEG